MIPLVLITGFLGSGKTTFLDRVVKRYADQRLVYLVNEFSPLDVDGARLDLQRESIVSVAGGSIFCRCKVTEFINALKDFGQQTPPPEGVVIEASGIADPRVVRTMLDETGLDAAYSLRRVICLIDPGSFCKLLKTLPNMTAQVEAADAVILNKIDLFSSDEIAQTRAALAEIRPDVPVVETSFAATDPDLFAEAPYRELRGEYAKCADPNYAHAEIELHEPTDWPRLRNAIDQIGSLLYRVKGRIPTAHGDIEADLSPSGWHEVKSDVGRGDAGLIFISTGDGADALESILRKIRNGDFRI